MSTEVRRDRVDVTKTADYVSALDSLTTAATTSGSFGDTLVAVADIARCCGFGMEPLNTLRDLTSSEEESMFWKLCDRVAEYRDSVNAPSSL
mgnify:CR=1 FL=1